MNCFVIIMEQRYQYQPKMAPTSGGSTKKWTIPTVIKLKTTAPNDLKTSKSAERSVSECVCVQIEKRPLMR